MYAQEHPDDDWIIGASYDSSLAPEGLFDARWLDEAVPDRPVVLRAWDYHTVWCNSVALERGGIDAHTPDPPLGEIPHRDDGSVLGTLREWGAVDLVPNRVPAARSRRRRRRRCGTAADYYLARGVTWVQDAWVNPDDIDVYLEAARRDALGIRFNLALLRRSALLRRPAGDVRRVAAPRHRRGLAAADGATPSSSLPTASSRTRPARCWRRTARVCIEHPRGQERSDSGDQHGMQVWEGDSLAEAARRVDELGFQIHIHAIGDAAARQALDAIEYAITSNGPRDRRPVIAHAQLVDDADLDRFAQLGVIANMQPLWAQLDALMTVLTVPRLGAGAVRQAIPDEQPGAFGRAAGLRIRLAGVLGSAAGRHRDRRVPADRRRGIHPRRLDARGDPDHRTRRCWHTPRRWPNRHSPDKPVPRGARSASAPAQIWCGSIEIHAPRPRSTFQESSYAEPSCRAGKFIPPCERSGHVHCTR